MCDPVTCHPVAHLLTSRAEDAGTRIAPRKASTPGCVKLGSTPPPQRRLVYKSVCRRTLLVFVPGAVVSRTEGSQVIEAFLLWWFGTEQSTVVILD